MTFETLFIDSRRRAALVLVAVVATFTASDAAFGQVLGCLGDPAITGRTCPEVVCVTLQAYVNNRCKNGELRSCKKEDEDCEKLRELRQGWVDCATARRKINYTCWEGGNLTHRNEENNAWGNVGKCDRWIADKCEDPCPLFPDTPLWTSEVPAAKTTASENAAIEFMIPVLERLATEGLFDTPLRESVGGRVDAPCGVTSDEDPPASSEGAEGRDY